MVSDREHDHRTRIMREIYTERSRQDAKWGQQDHVFKRNANSYAASNAKEAQARCVNRFHDGRGTYADILIEEVYEAIDADSEADARAELVQVAAVAVAAIQAIDRRQGVK